MSKKYYYLAASLPTLSFESKTFMSVNAFLESCKELLSSEDSSFVMSVLGEEDRMDVSGGMFQAWFDFDKSLKNELVYCRAKILGKDPSTYLRGERMGDIALEHLANQLLSENNLFEAETFLNKKKWQMLDDLSQDHYFDLEYIVIYGLKLKILSKYNNIDNDKIQELLETYKAIVNQ